MISFKCFFLLFIVKTTLAYIACVNEESGFDEVDLMVSTQYGDVLGRQQEQYDSASGRTLSWRSFLDIPFATPPVGELRFRPPVPQSSWGPDCLLDGRRLEGGPGKKCPQILLKFTLSGFENGGIDPASDEDCLMLDIHVPDDVDTSQELLPVLLWIHGGGYTGGTGGIYNPVHYMSHGIIVVSIRYRLGPLGFLSLGTSGAPGNAGMRDQVMAMKWVNQNIMQFGGDPDMVTVNGQSAGSFSTMYHLYSPLSAGLFRRIIAQSGSGGFSPSYHHFSEDRAAKYGKQAAIELGCYLDFNLEITVDCLRQQPLWNILSVDFLNELMSHPSIDSELMQDDSFLPLDPEDAITTGNYQDDVDILIGATVDESLLGTQWFLAAPELFGLLAELWDLIGPYALLQIHTSEITQKDIDLATDILRFYVGEKESLGPEDFGNLTAMTTDSFFWFGVHRFLDLHLENINRSGKTYQYIYAFQGKCQSISAPGLDSLPGVSHDDDGSILWERLDRPCTQDLTKEDSLMSLKMTSLWANFVKTGNPTPDTEDEMFSLPWTPLSENQRQYYVIDSEQRMELDPNYMERMEFWDSIYLKIKDTGFY